MPVEFVGHPILDDLHVGGTPEEFGKRWGFDGRAPLVALLPGSRWNEVRRHLPVMLEAAALMKREFPELQFVVKEPPAAFRDFTARCLARSDIPVKVVDDSVYRIMDASRLVIVASGTATLETACMLKPMVIIYKVAWLTYVLGRALVKLPYIGLVNVIAGRKIMPEFIQRHATPPKIARAALNFLRDGGMYAAALEELRTVRAHVGMPGASARAAAAVIRELGTIGSGRSNGSPCSNGSRRPRALSDRDGEGMVVTP
jgi:lipid-A-disaccharide synthase